MPYESQVISFGKLSDIPNNCSDSYSGTLEHMKMNYTEVIEPQNVSWNR